MPPKTKAIVEKEGAQGDHDCRRPRRQGLLRRRRSSRRSKELGRLDILVNNAGEQHPDEDITRHHRGAAAAHLPDQHLLDVLSDPGGAAAPEEGQRDHQLHVGDHVQGQSKDLLDYSATKGAITAFTRSLSENLVKDGIRVNAVAPGPIWTPLNPFGGKPPEEIKDFGKNTPMGRPGQPNEVAPSFLFLACEDSSYMSGQVLHPNGGIDRQWLTNSLDARNCRHGALVVRGQRNSGVRTMAEAKAKDAVALLKEDHRTVEDLFAQFEKASGDGRKQKLATEICTELSIHAQIEEEIFYPACEGKVEEDLLKEAYVEHDGAKVLIAEIMAGEPSDEFYDAKVKVLQEQIEHHVEEEEKRLEGLFSQARKAGLDMEALGEQLAARKEELKAEIEANGLPAPQSDDHGGRRLLVARALDSFRPNGDVRPGGPLQCISAGPCCNCRPASARRRWRRSSGTPGFGLGTAPAGFPRQ